MIFKKGDKVIIDNSAKGEVYKISPSGDYGDVFQIKITEAGAIHDYEDINFSTVEAGTFWWCMKSQLKPNIKLSSEADVVFGGILDEI